MQLEIIPYKSYQFKAYIVDSEHVNAGWLILNQM